MARSFRWGVVASVFLIGCVPGLAYVSDGSWIGWVQLYLGLGNILFVAVVAGSVCAYFHGRAEWKPSLAAWMLGSVLSIGLISRAYVVVHSSHGYEVLDRFVVTMNQRAADPGFWKIEQERAGLERGLHAAREGHPLLAPEGGYLAPAVVNISGRTGSNIRLVSVSSASKIAGRWETGLTANADRAVWMGSNPAREEPAVALAYLEVAKIPSLITLLCTVAVNLVGSLCGWIRRRKP